MARFTLGKRKKVGQENDNTDQREKSKRMEITRNQSIQNISTHYNSFNYIHYTLKALTEPATTKLLNYIYYTLKALTKPATTKLPT
jgi:hypothetical protein